jgi:hypothetical protein
LENAGADINPLRIIRRIKDDLQVPGLKDALITILQASNLQVSLLEGCQRILSGDTSSFAKQLQQGQSQGAFASGEGRSIEMGGTEPQLIMSCSRQYSLPRLQRLPVQT